MSTLRTNALEGVDAKNSITIVAGAGNITTTNVQEGLTKVWCRWSLSDQSAAVDSFNVASITDTGTGEGNINTTNNFRANESCPQFSSNDYHAFNGASGDSTFIRLSSANSSHSVADVSRAFLSAHGDLA